MSKKTPKQPTSPTVQDLEIQVEHQKGVFIETLAATGSVIDAVNAAGISQKTAYDWKETDEEFAKSWAEAWARAGDMLEHHAIRRATDGVDEPVFYQGTIVGHVRKRSDRLLEFLLTNAKVDRYRLPTSVHLSGAQGGPITIAVQPDAVRERLALKLHRAARFAAGGGKIPMTDRAPASEVYRDEDESEGDANG